MLQRPAGFMSTIPATIIDVFAAAIYAALHKERRLLWEHTGITDENRKTMLAQAYAEAHAAVPLLLAMPIQPA